MIQAMVFILRDTDNLKKESLKWRKGMFLKNRKGQAAQEYKKNEQ